MSTSQNDDPVPMDPISEETGLVRRSVFLTERVRVLAQQVRALDLADSPGPRDARAYYERGESRYSLGQYEQAIQDCDEVIRLDPTDAGAYYGRGRTHQRIGNPTEAERDFQKAEELGSTP